MVDLGAPGMPKRVPSHALFRSRLMRSLEVPSLAIKRAHAVARFSTHAEAERAVTALESTTFLYNTLRHSTKGLTAGVVG